MVLLLHYALTRRCNNRMVVFKIPDENVQRRSANRESEPRITMPEGIRLFFHHQQSDVHGQMSLMLAQIFRYVKFRDYFQLVPLRPPKHTREEKRPSFSQGGHRVRSGVLALPFWLVVSTRRLYWMQHSATRKSIILSRLLSTAIVRKDFIT